MAKTHKQYIERDDLNGSTHLEVSVYYDLGGMNYFSGKNAPRGFYLSVRPVTRGKNSTSYNLFSGRSRFLLETQRFTVKQFERAVAMAKNYEDELITAVVAENKAA